MADDDPSADRPTHAPERPTARSDDRDRRADVAACAGSGAPPSPLPRPRTAPQPRSTDPEIGRGQHAARARPDRDGVRGRDDAAVNVVTASDAARATHAAGDGHDVAGSGGAASPARACVCSSCSRHHAAVPARRSVGSPTSCVPVPNGPRVTFDIRRRDGEQRDRGRALRTGRHRQHARLQGLGDGHRARPVPARVTTDLHEGIGIRGAVTALEDPPDSRGSVRDRGPRPAAPAGPHGRADRGAGRDSSPAAARESSSRSAQSGTIRSKYQPADADVARRLAVPRHVLHRGDRDGREHRARLVARFDEIGDAVGLANAQGLTPYETVIAASLIETEAKLAEDQPLISAVIRNRLNDGMPLQIDSTLCYASRRRAGARPSHRRRQGARLAVQHLPGRGPAADTDLERDARRRSRPRSLRPTCRTSTTSSPTRTGSTRSRRRSTSTTGTSPRRGRRVCCDEPVWRHARRGHHR